MFKTLTFYFYPPRTVSRLNGVRATASSKHGAQISTSITPAVTHILVARGSDTPEFWKLVDGAPKSPGCLVVSSEWCSECIDHRRLLDPAQFVREVGVLADQNDENGKTEKIDKNKQPDGSEQTSRNEQAGRGGLDEQADRADRTDKQSNTRSIRSELSRSDQRSPQTDINADRSGAPASNSRSHGFAMLNRKQNIIEMLHELLVTRRSSGEEYSAKAYERALQALETQAPPEIRRGSDVAHLVSARMVQVIDQICEGKIAPSLVTRSGQSRHNVINLFCTVYGVGPHHARKLYDKGFRTLKQLMPVMDRNGQVSIIHHEDFIERMSRTEVAAHYDAVCKLARDIDASLELECLGSFRRGKLDCGDIDIIVTKPDSTLVQLTPVLDQLLQRMFGEDLATHTFTRHADRWLGATQVRGKWRRMDILLVPSKELGAAVLYYTGSGEFNRQMRWIAKMKNMRLNHNGLFTSGGELLESQDEHRIFQLLDIPYREPKDR